MFRGSGITMGGSFCKNLKQLVNVQVGEARVRPRKGSVMRVPISRYAPPGLSPRFPATYLKVKVEPGGDNRLFRGRSFGNQNQFANDLCVTVRVTQYMTLKRDGSPGPLKTTSSRKDCVSFRASSSKLQFEVQWNTTDDLDILLEEPDGFVVNRFNPTSPSGARLNRDNGGDSFCLPNVNGQRTREVVSYNIDDRPQTGTYVLSVQHLRNCRSTPTEYIVRAIVNGNVVKKRTGITDVTDRSVVGAFNFKVNF